MRLLTSYRNSFMSLPPCYLAALTSGSTEVSAAFLCPCTYQRFGLYLAVFVLKGTVDLEREEGEECEENMEVFDDSSSSPSGTLRNYPLTCKVLYSYKV